MNSTKKSMLLNVLKIVLGVLGALFVLLAVFALPGDVKELNLEEKTAALNNSKFGLMMGFTIFIVILGAVLIVGFFLFGLITDTKKTLKAVLSYAISGFAFLVLYVFAKGSLTQVAVKEGISTSTLKATEAGLYLTFFMVIVGFLLMLIGPFFKHIKK
jgi:hypothetical protein